MNSARFFRRFLRKENNQPFGHNSSKNKKRDQSEDDEHISRETKEKSVFDGKSSQKKKHAVRESS